MASRTGPTMSTQKKVVTYGKQSRKRQARSTLPSELLDAPMSHTGPTKEAIKPPATPAKSAQLNPPQKATSTAGGSKRQDCDTIVHEEKRPNARGDAVTKKRKISHLADTRPDPDTQSHSTSTSDRCQTQAASSPTEVRKGVTRRRDVQNSAKSPKTTPGTPADARARRARLKLSPDPAQTTTSSPGSRTRRPRLIDTLAAQRPESPESDSSPEDEGLFTPSFSSGIVTPSQQSSQTNSQSQPTTRPGVKLQGRRVRVTYGQSRSILSESSTLSASGMAGREDDIDALLSPPLAPINPDPFSFDDDEMDDDGEARPAIRSVHELRRAGANNRFADEMEDMLVRIGTPNHASASQRRSGLLELAQKLQHKDFIAQFRDHATRDKVFRDIGQEEDILSGFALAAILVRFLDFSPTTHLLRQLVDDGLWRLLSHLLRESRDIYVIGSVKLSKVSKASLKELNTSLMRMDIWHGRRLRQLSPQSLALQLLEVLCQQTDPKYSAGVVRDLGGDLLAIMDDYPQETGEDDVVFPLIISILEMQSSLTAEPDAEASSWTFRLSPKIAQFLHSSLQLWPNTSGDVDAAVFKLAINTTNTAQGAAGFNDGALLAKLSSCICAGFESTHEAVSSQRLRGETYDGFLLILGVMINVIEHCPPARESVDDSSLQSLVELYLRHQSSASEADSVEKSQLSVAFGYLAVLLGYLSLVAAARRRFAAMAGEGGISGLIGSIQEFISVYRTVDSKVYELEGLVRELERSQR